MPAVSEDALKAHLRVIASSTDVTTIRTSLSKLPTPTPPVAIPILLNRAATPLTSSIRQLLYEVLFKAFSNFSTSIPTPIVKRFTSLITSIQRSPPSTRDLVALVRLSTLLIPLESLSPHSVQLLLASKGLLITKTPKKTRGKVLSAIPKVLPPKHAYKALFSALDSYSSRPSDAVAAVDILADAWHDLSSDYREKYITSVATIALRVSSVSSYTVEAAMSTLSVAESNLLTAKLIQPLERALLREPETALSPSTNLLSAAKKLDLSSHTKKSLVPAIVAAVKNSNEVTRSNGVKLSSAVASRIADPSVKLETAITLCDVLKASRYAYQKVATVQAVAAFASALPVSNEVVCKVASVLLTWVSSKKESNDEARTAGVFALTKLLAIIPHIQRENMQKEMQHVMEFFEDILSGKVSEIHQKALLTSLSDSPPKERISKLLWNSNTEKSLEKIILASTAKTKQEVGLRAATVLADWALADLKVEDGNDIEISKPDDAVLKILLEPKSSLVLVDPAVIPEADDAICAVRCCVWIILSKKQGVELALGTLFRLCLDSRPQVSRGALKEVQKLQKRSNNHLASTMFQVLWSTQFSGHGGSSTTAKSYEFNDGMIFAEQLGKVLLAAVLPNIPLEKLPYILLAANHPRLQPFVEFGRSWSYSRFWYSIEAKLEKIDDMYNVEPDEDWLESCLQTVFGEDGLKSNDETSSLAAVNSLAMLCNPKRYYSTKALKRCAALLQTLASTAANLSHESFEALAVVKKAAELTTFNENESGQGGRYKRKSDKKSIESGSNARVSQQRQAETDRAKAAAANANAAAEKAKAAEELAADASKALSHATNAVTAIEALANVHPNGIHPLMSSMLSLVLPLSRIEMLESCCRKCIILLTQTSSPRLGKLHMDIASTLYGLERDFEVQTTVSSIIYALREIIPPPFDASDFSLISPIIRAALLRDPASENGSTTSGRKGSTKRRDAIAVVKAAAQVLLDHCKLEAMDAAVSAAALRAGSWTVRVLEREDGAFANAAEALALLTGTALTPGTDSFGQVLEGIISGKSSVRDAALGALARLPPLIIPTISCPPDKNLGRSLWLVRFDPEEANAELAEEMWSNYNHPLSVPDDAPELLKLLSHPESDIRLMSAKAIAEALCGSENEPTRKKCIPQMFALYLKSLPDSKHSQKSSTSGIQKGDPPAVKRGRDKRDDQQTEGADDGWVAREGVALAIENMATSKALTTDDITVVFSFLGMRGLGDSHDKVREHMSKASTAVVQAAGTYGPTSLLPMIEKQLNSPIPTSATKEEILHADRTHENLVMCLGAVAGFLPSEDPRIKKIADQVMKSAMKTPSEMVQNAAARCLIPLASSSIPHETEDEITKSLLSTIWSEKAGYGERRGAAYSLAGIGSGLGLKFLKRRGIINEIETAVAEKDPRRRQGAFILIETHAILMGRLFEPYAVATIPFLLSCMGDSYIEVRNACWAAAQASMAEISSQGVKMILPSLLDGLHDRQWRTKAGSAEVLGAMAFCAPRQLAQCLPQVVPKLADALADAHPKVVVAAESAINRIAAVVRSPEVRKLSPFLLAALRDPSGRTRGAIDAMLGTEFVHAIDAASLALLIPPLHRGLRDRSSELKKRSAAIVGSMCNNVSNHFDVVPYLGLLLPSLQITLLDAIPDVRRTSARALGALSVALGEKGLPGMLPWLVNALLGSGKVTTDAPGDHTNISITITSSAERSGAAMGLAEVAASMTDKKLEEVLGRVLTAGETSSDAREGGLMLIASLPRSLGERFEPKLALALTSILQGIADDADSVREAALDAGRNLVSAYAKTSLDHLLPELLNAMRDKLWRIRQAATRLLGDLLLVIAGALPDRPDIFGTTDIAGNDVESKPTGSDAGENGEEQEEGEGDDSDDDQQFESPEQAAAAMTTEAAMKVIEEILGFEKRNEVLAALYIIRCDVSQRVRQTGMQVWKSVVSNTPRVLREIMPCAVQQIVDGLGDEDDERRAAAGKTLSDLSQKLGDRVVPEVLPALRTGITSKDASDRIRRGACEGLGELVLASPKSQLEEYSDELIETVYQGLSDPLVAVRTAIAEVFASLHRIFGNLAVDSVIPKLIGRLSSGAEEKDAALALDGLKHILRSSGVKLMAVVVPRLLKETPLNTAAARALATSAIVAEGAFEVHIPDVAEAVIDSMEVLEESASVEPLDSVLAAIGECGTTCVRLFLDETFLKFNGGYADRRAAASRVCEAFCRSVNVDRVSEMSGSIIEILIRQLADTDDDAAKAAWCAIKQLSETVPSKKLSSHISIIRQSLRAASTGITVIETTNKIPGLQLPKAVGPFVPIFTEALVQGSPELREQAALGVSEMVELTNLKSLGPFVIKLTGPIIRVMSGRFAWQVDAACLKALSTLLKTAPMLLRTFTPQLQSTFIKCLSDTHRLVRVRACAALGALVPIQNRIEPLLNDLVSLGLNGDNGGSRSAAFRSCAQVFRLGKTLPDAAFTSIPKLIVQGLCDEDVDVSNAAGRCLGVLASRSSTSDGYKSLLDLVHNQSVEEGLEYTERRSYIRALGAIYLGGKDLSSICFDDIRDSIPDLYSFFNSGITQLQEAACATSAELFVLLSENKNMSQSTQSEKIKLVLKLAERAEFADNAHVRASALNAMKIIVLLDDVVLEMCASSIVTCAAAANTGIRESADKVLKKAFLTGKDLLVNEEKLRIAKENVNEEDQRFIDRRIPKLKLMPQSDTE